jgi:hypothetical protein
MAQPKQSPLVLPAVVVEHGTARYHVRPVDTSIGLRVIALASNLAGPALASFKSDADISSAVAYLIANPKLADYLPEMCRLLATASEVELNGARLPLGGDAGLYEVHFAGNYGALIAWLTAACEVNLAGFFAGLSDLGKRAVEALAAHSSTSPSPPAKTG